MTNDPGAPGEHPQPGNQGWSGGPQQPPYPGGYGQQPPPSWGGGYPPPGQPGYGGPAGMGPGGGPQMQAKGFFAALFDFGFNSFATPSVVKVLYIIGMVLLGLAYVGFVITAFTQDAGFGLLALIGGAIAVLFYLTLFRVALEFSYAVVRMSEDIHYRR